MGLFSSIKKAVKGVFKGIKKAFKSVFKAVSKLASSKLGKLIMTVAAIYTGGLAIAGGIQGWGAAAANGAGFMGKFVAGAEGFMVTLFNPIEATKNIAAGGGPLSAGQLAKIAPTVAGELASGVSQLATGTAESSAISGAAQGAVTTATGPPSVLSTKPFEAVAGVGQKVVEEGAKEAATGWLSKAGEFAKDFILSPTGASMIEGYAAGGAQEEQQKFDDRINRQWNDPNNPFQRQMGEEGMLSGTVTRGQAPIFNPGGQVAPGQGPQISTSGALPGEPLPVG